MQKGQVKLFEAETAGVAKSREILDLENQVFESRRLVTALEGDKNAISAKLEAVKKSFGREKARLQKRLREDEDLSARLIGKSKELYRKILSFSALSKA